MRIRILPLALGMMAISGLNQLQAGSGGPDAYGYVWKDSNEPSGPSFAWKDIVGLPGTVQATGLGDDNAVGQYNIGWDFHFYWSDYNKVKVGSNGWVSFNNVGNIASCFPAVPTAGGAGDNLLVAFMSDLTFVTSGAPNIGTIHYWTNNVDSFIVQYTNVPWWRQTAPTWVGSNTFQVLLSGQDSSITFHYLDTDEANLAVAAGCNSSFEIGIENITGNVGLNVASGTNSAVPADSFSIKFYYPPVVTFQVPDASPLWAANSENEGQFVYTNAPFDVQAQYGNVGNAAITNNIALEAKVKKHPGATYMYTSTAGLATGLAAGADSIVTFPSQLTLVTSGQYYLEVRNTNSQDINPSNNLNIVELAAVDNSGGYVQLSYCTGGAPDGAISWAGGGQDDGVAIKIVPPAYPMTMDSVSMFIAGDGDPNTPMPSGFSIVIYGSDINGEVDLNNVLQVENIAALDVIEGAWNRISLDSVVSVNSGAVFVQWAQGGAGIALGTEAVGPISRRSYEILGGAWSPYRENTVNEYLIQVSSTLPVGISDRIDLPSQVRVYPNPNHGLVNVAYTVEQIGDVHFTLRNLMGQEVWTKTHAGVSPGEYLFQVDTTPVGAGVYFLTMDTNGLRYTQKVVVE